jgi:hypothetical protein
VTSMTETIRLWDASAHEYRTVTVTATPAPRRTRRPSAKRAPAVRMPLDNAGSPIPDWWRWTAYAPGEPLADMRSHVKTPAMRTHRPAGIVPGADLGSSIALKPSDRLDV